MKTPKAGAQQCSRWDLWPTWEGSCGCGESHQLLSTREDGGAREAQLLRASHLRQRLPELGQQEIGKMNKRAR